MFQGLALNSEHYMSLLSARQKLVASNIANADTPGYHTQDINFQAEFENALGRPGSNGHGTRGIWSRNRTATTSISIARPAC